MEKEDIKAVSYTHLAEAAQSASVPNTQTEVEEPFAKPEPEHKKGQHLTREERYYISIRLNIDHWSIYKIDKELHRPYNLSLIHILVMD